VEVVPGSVRPSWKSGLFLFPVPGHGDLPNHLQLSEHWDGEELDGEHSTARICWLRDDQPQPADLERRRLVPGYLIADTRGQRWHYPAMRGNDNYSAPYGGLPGEYTFNARGAARLVLSPEYHQLWAQTARVWDYLVEAEPIGQPISQLELVQIAAASLAVNYRVGHRELAVLQQLGRAVISTQNLHVILRSICDVESVDKYLAEKKRDESPTVYAGQTFMAGYGDGDPGISPPAASTG
jgi:hypothetical protein